jgi:UDP-glucose 4-epimerase
MHPKISMVWEKKMKILVTGGAGFIGSHVVDLFIAKGFEVVIVDNLSTGRESNLNPKATFYEMDIRDPGLMDVFTKEKPDYVSHHAAQMDVRRSVAQPLYDAEINILGSINVIECARASNVKKFVYISSGGAAYGEPVYLPCDEKHPINPICQYGASKHTVEHYLYMYRVNYGLEYCVLRYPNVYGPRQDPKGEAGVVAIFIGKMLANEPVMINGDGEQTRDFVHVSECAQANYLALTAPSGIYNLGRGEGSSVNQIFEALRKITGYPFEAIHGPAKLGETRAIYLDATLANQVLGWESRITLEDGLRETLAYQARSEVLA